MKESIKKWFKNLKPVKYMTLLRNYNHLLIEYNVLHEAVANNCFDEVFKHIVTPSILEMKDKKINILKNKIYVLNVKVKKFEEKNEK